MRSSVNPPVASVEYSEHKYSVCMKVDESRVEKLRHKHTQATSGADANRAPNDELSTERGTEGGFGQRESGRHATDRDPARATHAPTAREPSRAFPAPPPPVRSRLPRAKICDDSILHTITT